VSTEPFTQWIIEDDFVTPRPDWEAAGAQIVADIRPFEHVKLRMLNASHSAIAYCGLLAGKTFVDEVMSDEVLGGYVERLMSHALLPALEAPPAFSLEEYRDALLVRFANPCLAHRCQQIAMDGSQKIAQRWLPTLQQQPHPLLLNALSAWVYYVLFTAETLEDPMAEPLLAQRGSTAPMAVRVAAVLACARITAGAVTEFDELVASLVAGIAVIDSDGLSALLSGR
jgi:fructuronate reductase